MSPSLPVILASGEPTFTPSNFMPSVLVEIAFTATYATPAASRTWTDVTQYVELADNISIGFGRQDELSVADANDLTLTLDNSDGRFTALRSASPYYPNVKIGRPIRVSATTVTGVAFIRFVGFIDEWPVEWNGTDAYAKASIRATSRLSRLGLTAKLKSIIEQEILTDDPDDYYTLGDPAGSPRASDSSGNGATSLAVTGSGTALTFGDATGPATDGLTALTLAGGQYLLGSQESATGTTQTMGCFMLRSGVPTVTETVLATTHYASGVTGFALRVLTSGVIQVTDSGLTNQVTGVTNVCNGSTHHVAVVRSGATWTLYVDGVSDATTGAGFSTALTSLTPQVGERVVEAAGGGPDLTRALAGVVAHAAFWSTAALSSTRIAAHAAAGLNGFAGERTDVRLLRLLAWVGVASTEVGVETGVETMTYQLTSGQSVVDALRECESTEGGVLFDGADGDIKFHNRSHRYLATAAATLDMAAQHVEADYAPRLDRSTLVNDITVDNPTTGETARQVDTVSSDEYGIATGSAASVADRYTALPEKASWHIASYAEPRMRCPSLTVNVLAHVGLTPSAETLLGVTVGDLLAVTNAPTQSDTTSPTYFVEGYTETIGPESYSITFNLSPTYPTLNTFVLDSATRGLLDTGILAY